jgi:hypothetical protein
MDGILHLQKRFERKLKLNMTGLTNNNAGTQQTPTNGKIYYSQLMT